MIRPLLLTLSVALGAVVAGADADERPDVAAGRLIAQRTCAGCHAIDMGQSPLPEAPPFALLYTRYPRQGGLDALLAGGMLPPDRPQEEGRGLGHWRMSTIALDPDQVINLKAYLRSLEPVGAR